ncbi:ABC transporter substrate-binding protein [Rhodoplanes sp. Z2-YC6860]|nr:ABC transporter substrate-binding protein [Rhodoplanes sp. Z2-YC6860]
MPAATGRIKMSRGRNSAVGGVAVALTLAVCAVPAADAQQYPAQPITFVVSTTPGASPDIVARLFAHHLGESLRQTVVVENRGGANGQIAVGAVARAPADGYTFLVTTAATLTTNPSLYPKTGALAVTGLKPVTKLVDLDFVVTARPSLNIANVQDLIARAKAEPGKLIAATTALGSAAYLTAELFKESAGIDFLTVAHNGGGQAVNAVLGNQADLLFETIALSAPLIEGGKLVPLAVTSNRRSEFLPNVPTAEEAGVAGFVVSGWVAVAAPKDTPDAIVKTVQSALRQAGERDALKKSLANLKAHAVLNSPEDFAALLQRERAMWDRVIKKAAISLE